MLHDNANQIQDLIASFGWELLDRPSYSLDLAPMVYQLFLLLEMHLDGQQRDDGDEAQTIELQLLSNQTSMRWDSKTDFMIQKLPYY